VFPARSLPVAGHATMEYAFPSLSSIKHRNREILNYWGVHPVARVSSNVNKPPYTTMFGARFYCALTLHVSAPIGGHLIFYIFKLNIDLYSFIFYIVYIV
jgi:hypothetical protein